MTSESTNVRPPNCLILGPRTVEFTALIVSLRNVLARMGVELITLDRQVEYGGLVSDAALQIPRTIENADAVIVDLTGANPNVMYELGFAHALKKPVLPIVSRRDPDIPSDLQGYLYYAYDESDPFDLSQTVDRWLRRTLGERLP